MLSYLKKHQYNRL